jgi:uncharacterized protein (TIGR02452 family)
MIFLERYCPTIWYIWQQEILEMACTDYFIYSPHVPVFRDDEDVLILEPYRVSVISSPAVNQSRMGTSIKIKKNSAKEKGSSSKKNKKSVSKVDIDQVMMSRLSKVLFFAWKQGHRRLVLGAWGCGEFGNDPLVF